MGKGGQHKVELSGVGDFYPQWLGKSIREGDILRHIFALRLSLTNDKVFHGNLHGEEFVCRLHYPEITYWQKVKWESERTNWRGIIYTLTAERSKKSRAARFWEEKPTVFLKISYMLQKHFVQGASFFWYIQELHLFRKIIENKTKQNQVLPLKSAQGFKHSSWTQGFPCY